MKRHILIVLCSLIAIPVFATRQVQDKLHYQDTVYEIGGHTDFPLEDYFRSFPKEQKKKDAILSSRWLTTNGMVRLPSTACRRGYVATWTVESSTLYVTNITVESSQIEIEMDEFRPIFGDRIKNGRLCAFWFNGPIRVEDILLVFEAGKLIKILSPDRNSIKTVYKDLKEQYSEQRKKDSQQPPAGDALKAAPEE